MSPWHLRSALQFSEGHRIASLTCVRGPQRLHGGGCLLAVLGNALQRGKNTASAHGEERSHPSAYLMWGFYCWDMTCGVSKSRTVKATICFSGPNCKSPNSPAGPGWVPAQGMLGVSGVFPQLCYFLKDFSEQTVFREHPWFRFLFHFALPVPQRS